VDGAVKVSGGPGDPTGSNPYLIRFEGPMGGTDQPTIPLDASGLAATARTLARLETHKFGVYRTMRRTSPWEVWPQFKKARPPAVFWVIYPVLITTALVATVLVAC
jgi:hypothetical protein